MQATLFVAGTIVSGSLTFPMLTDAAPIALAAPLAGTWARCAPWMKTLECLKTLISNAGQHRLHQPRDGNDDTAAARRWTALVGAHAAKTRGASEGPKVVRSAAGARSRRTKPGRRACRRPGFFRLPPLRAAAVQARAPVDRPCHQHRSRENTGTARFVTVMTKFASSSPAPSPRPSTSSRGDCTTERVR